MSQPSQSPDDARRTNAPSSTSTRRGVLGAAAAAITAGLAGCAGGFVRIESAETTVEREFDDVDRLRIADANDDVAVEGYDGDAVVVRAHKRAHGRTELSELGLDAALEDGTLQLGTQTPNVVGIGGGSVDLEVEVPGSVSVERVGTDDGDVAVGNVDGDATLESDDGDVAASRIGGDLSATTADGEIALDRVDGVVAARSDDGDVTVRDPGSVREISSDDGDVVAAVPAVDGTAEIRSADGDVTVTLGDALDAEVTVTADDGRVTVAGGLDRVETATETTVVGTAGDGTNELAVHSDDGDVTVSRV